MDERRHGNKIKKIYLSMTNYRWMWFNFYAPAFQEHAPVHSSNIFYRLPFSTNRAPQLLDATDSRPRLKYHSSKHLPITYSLLVRVAYKCARKTRQHQVGRSKRNFRHDLRSQSISLPEVIELFFYSETLLHLVHRQLPLPFSPVSYEE